MTILQAIITVVVALIGSLAGTFSFVQFMIKRKDDKEERDIQKMIDASIYKAREEARKELQEGLEMFGEDDKKRSEANASSIHKNTEMIQEIIKIQKESNEKFDKLANSLITLNEATIINSKIVKTCAEGIRSTTYDKILLVANRALNRNAITISEKANLIQLYQSWVDLQGEDPRIKVYYEDCIKLPSIPDKED